MRVVVDAGGLATHPMELAMLPGVPSYLLLVARACRAAGADTHIIMAEHLETVVDGISYWPVGRHPQVCDVFITSKREAPAYIRAEKVISGDSLWGIAPPIRMLNGAAKIPGKLVWMAGANRGLWHRATSGFSNGRDSPAMG